MLVLCSISQLKVPVQQFIQVRAFICRTIELRIIIPNVCMKYNFVYNLSRQFQNIVV